MTVGQVNVTMLVCLCLMAGPAFEVAPSAKDQPVQQTVKPIPSKAKQANAKDYRRHMKSGKKSIPKVAVRPRTDRMYHGLLEDSHRYDPRPNSRHGGMPDPQILELSHDHFQELDRNLDGKIDPVERAFSRLDIDRDLQHRQPQ